jgi:sugar fermentation stimulation protein A
MRFPDPLIRGTLIKRYKRFLADVTLADGAIVTAHCPNPGAMTGLDTSGSEVWLSPARNPARKLRYTFELILVGSHFVGINTSHPNAIVAEAVADGRIAELEGYDTIRREVRYGKNSRIDLLLEGSSRPTCYVEVKNVHLRRDAAPVNGLAEFPDSVTARGLKHLVELSDMVAVGKRAVMAYIVQREDCGAFALAGDIDPAYAAGFRAARAAGVEVICYSCKLSVEGIELDRPLPVDM